MLRPVTLPTELVSPALAIDPSKVPTNNQTMVSAFVVFEFPMKLWDDLLTRVMVELDFDERQIECNDRWTSAAAPN